MKQGKIWGQTELIHANGVLEFHRIDFKKNVQCSKHKHKYKWNGFFIESLNNVNMNELLENQRNAMISLLKNKKIPFLSIEINKRNEETLGELFSYFILETVFMGENLRVNPFNQPAVEQLKVLTKRNLFKRAKNNF